MFLVILVKLEVFSVEVYRRWKTAEMGEHQVFTVQDTVIHT